MITNFKPKQHYRVLEVVLYNGIFYKITQQKKYWFWLSRKYYNVKSFEPYKEPKTIYFKNKEEVDLFIKHESNKKTKPIIVYDSKLAKP